LMTMRAWTNPPTMNESTAMIDNHEIVASHPGESQLRAWGVTRKDPPE
jgi:hypothetical protein